MTVGFRGRRLLAGAAACVALVACATTTVDTAETPSSASPSATTTTSPSGTVGELLDRLLTEVAALSERVVENEGDEPALARVEGLWAAAEPDVSAARPDLLPDFGAAMELVRRSVERRRPADADKAANNLRVLIAAVTG